MTSPNVHDLVRVDTSLKLCDADAPPWVAQRLVRSPWAVVRREFLPGAVAVGFRGATRSERFGTTISPANIRELVTPWELDANDSKNERLRKVYRRVTTAASASGLRIAPVGSFGFELGSGEPITHAASDLDLLVDDVTGIDRAQIDLFRVAIDEISRESGVAIDAELAFQQGGVALREALSGSASVLFKTSAGPQMMRCPI